MALLVRDLLGRQWHDRDGQRLPLIPDQVLVVTPYNAQIRAIRDALARGRMPGRGQGGHGRRVIPGTRGGGGHLLDGHLLG